MDTQTQIIEQIAPYQPWLTLCGVLVLFLLLRATRRALRRRVDEIGYWLLGERGRLIWFWINAPGVMLHELSHAAVVLLFTPFGFRITSITLFRVQSTTARDRYGRVVRSGGRQSLQLGEVQYVRPQGKLISYVGDGLSGIAPLFGGTAMFAFLYWIATGYNLWDIPLDAHQNWQLLRPDWPWWTLIFAPYLILTVTSELWPSRQDWTGARWFMVGLCTCLLLALGLLWYTNHLARVLSLSTFMASRIDFALVVLVVLDLLFLIIAELTARGVRH
ncbi:hypothetical protein [Ktedonobacter racemifer]|uniref:Uncharacterized protein n=1 Tax=Ktedonobacter racemifer DSM 44963 TaxID=485913 RepID=D6TJL7_KTERA|nr:hypothetical protein [Ktedonobacter racemifer]EFH89624.1 conserved hypothetical protein [Ktedonobacter racemifer DSM 44963]